MVTMEGLAVEIRSRAILYLRESGEQVDSFPSSIVDFVLEYAVESCNFPNHYTDDDIAVVLDRYKGVLAMACQEVYSRAGLEGQKSHTEGAITMVFDTAWISGRLLNVLPNYVNTPGSLRI